MTSTSSTTDFSAPERAPCSAECGPFDGLDRPPDDGPGYALGLERIESMMITTTTTFLATHRRRRAPGSAPPDSRDDRAVTAPFDGHGESGQAAVLVVGVAAGLLVAMLIALGTMGRTTLDRTRAQTAADAAALASLEGGRSSASSLAARHGAVLVEWYEGPGPDEVTVTVRLGETSATARASNAP